MLRAFRSDLETTEQRDVARLKKAIPELAPLPDLAVAALYSRYSSDHYAAEWMELPAGDGAPRDFEHWLFS